MKERVGKLLGVPYTAFVGTFHSFCVRLLRKHSGKPNFSIYKYMLFSCACCSVFLLICNIKYIKQENKYWNTDN